MTDYYYYSISPIFKSYNLCIICKVLPNLKMICALLLHNCNIQVIKYEEVSAVHPLSIPAEDDMKVL